jgi:hypothetical protein
MGGMGEEVEALTLVRHSVPARLPARRAVVKPIAAQANVNLRLARTAILFAVALVFRHVALHTVIFGFGRGGHERTLARVQKRWKVPLVTVGCTLPVRPNPKVEAAAKRMLG